MVPRVRLIERKADLYSALRTLERDREDGSIDPESYRLSRERYEVEAAHILEQLDMIPADGASVTRPAAGITPRLAASLSLCVILAAALIALGSAVRGRATASAVATPTPVLPPAIARAETLVTQHPGSATAFLQLGTALMNAGDNPDADSSFRRAMSLAPTRPEPITMHAMVIGSSGKPAEAEALLRSVERTHPKYARAWLLDGLISSRRAATRGHAILAWKRFLRLQPTGAVARTVRALLTQAGSRP